MINLNKENDTIKFMNKIGYDIFDYIYYKYGAIVATIILIIIIITILIPFIDLEYHADLCERIETLNKHCLYNDKENSIPIKNTYLWNLCNYLYDYKKLDENFKEISYDSDKKLYKDYIKLYEIDSDNEAKRINLKNIIEKFNKKLDFHKIKNYYDIAKNINPEKVNDVFFDSLSNDNEIKKKIKKIYYIYKFIYGKKEFWVDAKKYINEKFIDNDYRLFKLNDYDKLKILINADGNIDDIGDNYIDGDSIKTLLPLDDDVAPPPTEAPPDDVAPPPTEAPPDDVAAADVAAEYYDIYFILSILVIIYLLNTLIATLVYMSELIKDRESANYKNYFTLLILIIIIAVLIYVIHTNIIKSYKSVDEAIKREKQYEYVIFHSYYKISLINTLIVQLFPTAFLIKTSIGNVWKFIISIYIFATLLLISYILHYVVYIIISKNEKSDDDFEKNIESIKETTNILYNPHINIGKVLITPVNFLAANISCITWLVVLIARFFLAYEEDNLHYSTFLLFSCILIFIFFVIIVVFFGLSIKKYSEIYNPGDTNCYAYIMAIRELDYLINNKPNSDIIKIFKGETNANKIKIEDIILSDKIIKKIEDISKKNIKEVTQYDGNTNYITLKINFLNNPIDDKIIITLKNLKYLYNNNNLISNEYNNGKNFNDNINKIKEEIADVTRFKYAYIFLLIILLFILSKLLDTNFTYIALSIIAITLICLFIYKLQSQLEA